MISAPLALALFAAAAQALAQEAAETGGDMGAQASLGDIDRDGDGKSGFLAAGKFGGIVPFSGMTPFVAGGLELGWIFDPGVIGVYLDVTYATPKGDGTESDSRVAGGEYSWELTQKQLVLQPTFQYRFSGGSITPYIGIGPRIYFTESVSKSSAPEFELTRERSTEFGVGLPIGLEFAVGPGALFAELLLQWGPLDHTITGDSHFGAVSMFIGYRAVL
jgi:hypothetical protein